MIAVLSLSPIVFDCFPPCFPLFLFFFFCRAVSFSPWLVATPCLLIIIMASPSVTQRSLVDSLMLLFDAFPLPHPHCAGSGTLSLTPPLSPNVVHAV